jgi:predicted SprT family Zn-dependent metalloprotease
VIDLTPIISEAGTIYLKNWDGLRWCCRKRAVTQAEVMKWLLAVSHEWKVVQPGGIGHHATAYYQRQSIRYNQKYLLQLEQRSVEEQHTMLLDLVLHELGHLFTYYFNGTTGHDYTWQQVGLTVGYAWVGCTTDRRRMAYIREAQKTALLRRMERAIKSVEVAA